MAPASPPGDPGPSGFSGPAGPAWTPLAALASGSTLDSRRRPGHLGGPLAFSEAGVLAPLGTLLLPWGGPSPPILGGRPAPQEQPELQAPFTSSETSGPLRHTHPHPIPEPSPQPSACQGSHLFSIGLGCLALGLCPLHLFSSTTQSHIWSSAYRGYAVGL